MKENEILLKFLEPSLAVITLNRKEKHNALTIEMMERLCEELEALGESKDLQALIIQGAGLSFCTGLDINEVANPKKIKTMVHLIGKVFLLISQANFITISLVDGKALGGGAGIMLASDFSIVSEKAQIGFPEVQRGLIPAQVAVLLQKKIGGSKLYDLLLLGEIIDGHKALNWGLATDLVASTELHEKAKSLVHALSQASPEAVKVTKRWIMQLHMKDLKKNLEDAQEIYLEGWALKDAREGIEAFLEKRPPVWALKNGHKNSG